ncbi:hypothetical protein [Sphaerisporangium sp. NPDC051011]|uniref:hypothetical protein n=1 Tax=Sphaerisporangium sp. NPDC051011 TaxID=3155792 RepID=UPI0034098728
MIRVRRAVPRDAAALTAVQTASWRAAFRGLMPDGYLAHLNTAAVVAALAEAGYAEATAWVFERDARARSFYRGQGWSEDGARDGSGDGFDLTIVRHRRPLPAR